MRTSTAAWAAALAVMSMSGPFTTAHAAPARAHAAEERPRPFYAKLRKRQGFNDSDSDSPDSKSPLVPLLGGSSSSTSPPPKAPPPPPPTSTPDPTQSDAKNDPTGLINTILGGSDTTTTSPRIPLTTSTSEPLDKQPPSQSSDSGPDPVNSLLTTLLGPTTTDDLTRPTGQSDAGPNGDESSTSPTHTDPLLGSITGQLSNVIPTPSSSDNIVGGVTSILHQTTDLTVPTLTLPGTGNSGPETTPSGILGSIIPSLVPTGRILPTLSGSGNSGPDNTSPGGILGSIVPSVLPTGGILPTGTGNSGPDTTRTGLLGSIVPSVLPTGGILPTLSGPVGSVLPTGGRPIGTGVTGLPGTGITSVLTSVLSSVQSGVNGVTQPASVLPTITGTGGLSIPTVIPTGGIPGVPSSVKPPDVTSIVPTIIPTGITGPVTNPLPTINPINSPVVSSILPITTPTLPLTSIVTGTGNTPIPTGSTFTVTNGDTSVVVTVPNNSAATGSTAPPDRASTASAPVVTASNETESTKPSNASERPNSSQTTTVNDTTDTRTGSTAPTTSAPVTPAASTTRSVTPASEQPQVSIVATGTDTQTTLSLPTTWSFAPHSTNTEGSVAIASATTATATSGGLPTTMPRLVQPANGMPVAPSNFTLVQVGFAFGLNYPFVVGKPESASQIFAYLPKGIAYGLGVPKENVLMNALMPYDTSQALGYITTLAQVYIPTELVNELQLHLHIPTSPIYLNPSTPVKDLMNMVNPTIPILPGAQMDGYSSSSVYNPAATTRAGEGDGAPIGGDSGSSKKVSGASVGIGLGAIGGAAVYAAAMIYVARRYRQKRKGHQRASSVQTVGEMTQRSSGGGMGGLFMSGANGRMSPRTLVTNSGGRNSRTSNGSSNGRSVREQGISAPLMSENSLGWD